VSFKAWVDEFFFNSSVDLEILRKAFNAIVDDSKKVEDLSTIDED